MSKLSEKVSAIRSNVMSINALSHNAMSFDAELEVAKSVDRICNELYHLEQMLKEVEK